MTDDMTAGELYRNHGRLEALVTEGFARLESKLDAYVLRSVHEAEMRGIEARITEVEKDVIEAQSRQRWVVGVALSTFVGLLAVVVAIVGLATDIFI